MLVIAGLLIGLLPGVPAVRVPPEVVSLVVLPPLLYAASEELPWRDLRAVWRPVIILAVGLVLASAAAVAAVAGAVAAIPASMAFVLGAVLASTDPVAVSALGRRLSLPPRVQALVQAESLFNDATSLVLFQIAVSIAVAGTAGTSAGGASAAWRRAVRGPGGGRGCGWSRRRGRGHRRAPARDRPGPRHRDCTRHPVRGLRARRDAARLTGDGGDRRRAGHRRPPGQDHHRPDQAAASLGLPDSHLLAGERGFQPDRPAVAHPDPGPVPRRGVARRSARGGRHADRDPDPVGVPAVSDPPAAQRHPAPVPGRPGRRVLGRHPRGRAPGRGPVHSP